MWDYIAQGAVNVVVLLSLNQILSMYTLTPETRALAWTLVMIHNGMSIFLWPASFVLPNALRAANDVRFTMVVATASMLVWRMGLSWVLCVQMGMGASASGTPWSLTGSAALYALWPGSSAVPGKRTR